MKNQHRKLALRGETIRALRQGELAVAQGGWPKTRDPVPTNLCGGTNSGDVHCQTGDTCNSLDCSSGC
jgi:hypothetical protein